MNRLYRQAIIRARTIAAGRLHDDECVSEAGIAVTRALREHDPARSSIRTFIARLVRWGVLQAIRANDRYKHRSEAWWNRLRSSDATPLDPADEVRNLIEAGASLRQMESYGCGHRESRRLIKLYRGSHARKKS